MYSLFSRVFYKQNKNIHAKAVNSITDLIEQAVFIEEIPGNPEKYKYDKAYRFYVPVRAGDKVYPVRIVALHQKNNAVKLEADVYDVILEQPVPSVISSEAGSAERQQAATISIADLLRNVKDAGGKAYTDPNIYSQKGVNENNTKEWNAIYADKKQAFEFIRPKGLQLPKGDKLKGSNNSIDAKEDIVKESWNNDICFRTTVGNRADIDLFTSGMRKSRDGRQGKALRACDAYRRKQMPHRSRGSGSFISTDYNL